MTRIHAPRRYAIVLLSGLLGAASQALAQDDGRQGDAARQEQARAERAIAEGVAAERARSAYGPTLSLDFPGGTLADYVNELKRAAEPAPTNILIRGEAAAIPVGLVELRDVSLHSALQLISGDYRTGAESWYNVATTNLGSDGGGATAFLVGVQDLANRGLPSQPHADVLVLSLREMTTPLPGDPPEVVVPAETVLTAVEAAVEVASQGDAPVDIKYHSESGLLIMAGPERTLEAAEEVFARMNADVHERRGRAREIQQIQGLTNPDALASQLEDLRAEAELAAVQAEMAHFTLIARHELVDELRQLVEAGGAPTGDLRRAELEARSAEAAERERRIELERAQRRVEHSAAALERSQAIAAGGGADTEVHALREENAMLRDRLAAMDVQIQQLRAQLEKQAAGGGAR